MNVWKILEITGAVFAGFGFLAVFRLSFEVPWKSLFEYLFTDD